MRAQALEIVEELAYVAAAARRRADRARPGVPAVAGRRPLRVPRLPRVPPRARGRRRDPARRSRHRPRHPARGPGPVEGLRQAARGRQGQGPREDPAGAVEGQLARHRAPAGLPRLRRREDLRRERRGQRRAPVPRPALQRGVHRVASLRIPLLREKAAEVLARIGVDPRSHAGKSLMDTLETYPRDEIFHTPADGAGRGHPGRRCRPSVAGSCGSSSAARPTAATSRCSCYLPRDRYNTAVRERFSQILLDRFHGDSIEFNVRMNESTTARVHFVVHPPLGAEIPDVDARDLERLFTDASRSWRDDFVSAAVDRVRRGPRLAARPPLRRLVPGGLQGGLLGHDGRARPRSARGHRGRRDPARDRPLALLSRSTPAAARPG